jgi:peptidoglycan/xylan/chitin deacetylase (PgdA/CDA1 family)
VKILICHIVKYLGLFQVCRRLFRHRLLILCYHGFELADEAAFMPGVFMRQATFARRMEALSAGGYNVLPLAEALEGLAAGTLPPNSVCLTIDDGFYSVLDKAAPILARYRYPSTLYVTSYHVEKQTPIFRLVIQYMFWKTRQRKAIQIEHERWGVVGSFDLSNEQDANRLCWRLIDHGERLSDEQDRHLLCSEVGALLDVSYQEILDSRWAGLLSPAEIRQLYRSGMDIQLHTRRHRPSCSDKKRMKAELLENARDLHAILPRSYAHFCYPSGQWGQQHPEWLNEWGIASATTCDAGMNTASTNRLALYRVLDSESMPDIVFEAELAGFGELLRIISGKRRRSDFLRRQSAVPAVRLPAGVSIIDEAAYTKSSVASRQAETTGT